MSSELPRKSYVNPDWVSIFKNSDYPDFEAWWNAEGELVEEGNFRGKDDNAFWSMVHRITLNDGKIVYLKRQQNHLPNNFILKLLKIPTFAIEWRNFRRMRAAGIPTMNIVVYHNRKHQGNRQCLIVSENLEGMEEIAKVAQWYDEHGWPPREQRRAILTAMLKVIKQAHNEGIIHNALYGRHLYVNIPFIDDRPVIPNEIKACFIDLERAKFPGKNSIKFISRDLKTMYWDIPQWPNSDKMWFFKQYLGIDKLTPKAKEKARLIIGSSKIK